MDAEMTRDEYYADYFENEEYNTPDEIDLIVKKYPKQLQKFLTVSKCMCPLERYEKFYNRIKIIESLYLIHGKKFDIILDICKLCIQ